MGPWVVPAASAAASFIQNYLGRKQETETKLGPEAQQALRLFYEELRRGTPSYLTAPISARFAGLRRGISETYGEELGPASGLETAQLIRATAAEGRALGEVGERHRGSLLRAIASLAGGAGVTETTAPLDIGPSIEDIGWAIFMATQKKKSPEGVFYPGGVPGHLSRLW
jgi:hypothetical protein